MKQNKKLLLAIAIVMSCSVYSASAQIYVHVQPIPRVVIRTEAPSPQHVWVHEDWRERDGRYEDHGGRWVEPPAPGYRYHEGHWDHDHRGHAWHEGGWNKHEEGGDRHKDGGHR